jgi:hypothetical protein
MFSIGPCFERHGVDDGAHVVKNIGFNFCDPPRFLSEVVEVFEKYGPVVI